jgi:parallel beta-helix repeat protein
MHNHSGSNAILTNCTFSGNTADSDGGGIRNWDSSPTVTNCILWDNNPDGISSAGASVPVVNYSGIRGGHIGTWNINTEPNFVDANNHDPNLVNLRLLPGSPCIDAGNTTAVPSGIFLDMDGNPRGLDDPANPDMGVNVLGVTVDMGAYEFHPCPIAGDINCDGIVDFKDVAILCGDWLAGTEPEL